MDLNLVLGLHMIFKNAPISFQKKALIWESITNQNAIKIFGKTAVSFEIWPKRNYKLL